MFDAENEVDASHPALSENFGVPVQMKGLSLSKCKVEEVHVDMDPILDPDYTLHDIIVKNCRVLADSMCWNGFCYSHEMVSVLFRYAENHASMTVLSAFREENTSKGPEKINLIVIMDGRHCHHVIERLK